MLKRLCSYFIHLKFSNLHEPLRAAVWRCFGKERGPETWPTWWICLCHTGSHTAGWRKWKLHWWKATRTSPGTHTTRAASSPQKPSSSFSVQEAGFVNERGGKRGREKEAHQFEKWVLFISVCVVHVAVQTSKPGDWRRPSQPCAPADWPCWESACSGRRMESSCHPVSQGTWWGDRDQPTRTGCSAPSEDYSQSLL